MHGGYNVTTLCILIYMIRTIREHPRSSNYLVVITKVYVANVRNRSDIL
jgi:hypothetical protein